jgi:hypothetical protein
MSIGGKQISVIVFISALFSTVATVGGAATTFAHTLPGNVGTIVSGSVTGIGVLGMAWTAFIHTIDTGPGQPAPAPTAAPAPPPAPPAVA